MSTATTPNTPPTSGSGDASSSGTVPRRKKPAVGTSLLARGEPMVWLTGGALALATVMIVGLLSLVFIQGLKTFWMTPIYQYNLASGEQVLGREFKVESFTPEQAFIEGLPDDERALVESEIDVSGGTIQRRLIRSGNFELTNNHFTWVYDFQLAATPTMPEHALEVDRFGQREFVGLPKRFELREIDEKGNVVSSQVVTEDPEQAVAEFAKIADEAADRRESAIHIQEHDIGNNNTKLKKASLDVTRAELKYGLDSPKHQEAIAALEQLKKDVDGYFEEDGTFVGGANTELKAEIDKLNFENRKYLLVGETIDGREVAMHAGQINRVIRPNHADFSGFGYYTSRWNEYLFENPREANMAGGIFPHLVGTIIMVIIMCVLVVPFGVLAALYIREYAKAGFLVSVIRIAINNLAGVPSIVFGVFGLGFFIYIVGGYIDGGPDRASMPILPSGQWFGLLAGCAIIGGIGAFSFFASLSRAGQPKTPYKRVMTYVSLVAWVLAAVTGLALVATTPFFDGFYQAQISATKSPVFGKGGLIWASFTLALLTLPVVIVSTEEALSAVPNSMREGSYGCGASKWQTIQRIVLPRAMPGIMTGTILAMARGAGEVAPLMIVGVVAFTDKLPIAADPGEQFGVNRSFLHLGFHIYNMGFQSQDSEGAKPLVYTTTFLLILIVAILNIAAITLRSRLKRRFMSSAF